MIASHTRKRLWQCVVICMFEVNKASMNSNESLTKSTCFFLLLVEQGRRAQDLACLDSLVNVSGDTHSLTLPSFGSYWHDWHEILMLLVVVAPKSNGCRALLGNGRDWHETLLAWIVLLA